MAGCAGWGDDRLRRLCSDAIARRMPRGAAGFGPLGPSPLGEAASLGDEPVAVLPEQLSATAVDAHSPADAEVPEDLAAELAAVVDALDLPAAPVGPVNANGPDGRRREGAAVQRGVDRDVHAVALERYATAARERFAFRCHAMPPPMCRHGRIAARADNAAIVEVSALVQSPTECRCDPRGGRIRGRAKRWTRRGRGPGACDRARGRHRRWATW